MKRSSNFAMSAGFNDGRPAMALSSSFCLGPSTPINYLRKIRHLSSPPSELRVLRWFAAVAFVLHFKKTYICSDNIVANVLSPLPLISLDVISVPLLAAQSKVALVPG